jgi:hypothetical protein
MAKSVTLNITDTTGGTAASITMPAKNYGADYSVKGNIANLVDVTNLTSPTDAPSTERFSLKSIKDIYKGTSVTEAYKSPNKGGFSLLSQCNVVATITDSEDSDYRVDLPISAHLVIAGPYDSNITTAHLTTIANRAHAGLYETDGTSRLPKLVRGALVPTDM